MASRLLRAGLGGFLIGCGALASQIVLARTGDNFLAALTFSFGLTLLLLSEASLFTGACTKVAGLRLERKKGTLLLRENARRLGGFFGDLGLILLGNALGVLLLVLLSDNSGLAAVATVKIEKPLLELFSSGILCNVLVCLAVLLYRKTGKIIAIIMPVMLFVICGFEHSVANLYFFFGNLAVWDFLLPLFVVAIGNVVGGVAVTLAFWALSD